MKFKLSLSGSTNSNTSSCNKIEHDMLPKPKLEHYEMIGLANNLIYDDKAVVDIDMEEVNETTINENTKDASSSMQNKFCKLHAVDVKKVHKKYINNVLSEMQQKFCDTASNNENNLSSKNELCIKKIKKKYEN
ncbi:unnamed protein product [Meganyctiphanes norvegica]|uniref:Uncharacterized protein n=1 Tax=Meganyctiphanes norvegica TaxID=48144 RepID=A0AAV2SKM4_MEGNR